MGARAGTRRLFVEGAWQIALAGVERHPDGFAALNGEPQDSVLKDLEEKRLRLFEILVDQTYGGYYSHPTVLQGLGVGAPPQPRGHTVEPLERGLVERVPVTALMQLGPTTLGIHWVIPE